ncbi:hypothetical protein SKAU_G00144410 [Synaphobranchus kaupii]|uniref:Uncharacterized protein n=1 Tax=Synaphobranchus kaupii TaxID=118154 RepID=A0A9Q1FTT6_SYNKA|nr:hypothetical protein SKAU_G00144410 [Synaphobranchus kaupii]
MEAVSYYAHAHGRYSLARGSQVRQPELRSKSKRNDPLIRVRGTTFWVLFIRSPAGERSSSFNRYSAVNSLATPLSALIKCLNITRGATPISYVKLFTICTRSSDAFWILIPAGWSRAPVNHRPFLKTTIDVTWKITEDTEFGIQ